jgi:hypothetical protein
MQNVSTVTVIIQHFANRGSGGTRWMDSFISEKGSDTMALILFGFLAVLVLGALAEMFCED